MKIIVILILVMACICALFTSCIEDKDKDKDKNKEEPPAASGEVTNENNGEDDGFKTTEFTVWGMTCVNCENKISNTLMELDGVIEVTVDRPGEKVTVVHERDLDVKLIESAILSTGYDVA